MWGLVRAVNVISEARLNINQLITDRHKQNAAWIKRNLPDMVHFFEMWHISKGKIAFLVHKVMKTQKKKHIERALVTSPPPNVLTGIKALS